MREIHFFAALLVRARILQSFNFAPREYVRLILIAHVRRTVGSNFEYCRHQFRDLSCSTSFKILSYVILVVNINSTGVIEISGTHGTKTKSFLIS